MKKYIIILFILISYHSIAQSYPRGLMSERYTLITANGSLTPKTLEDEFFECAPVSADIVITFIPGTIASGVTKTFKNTGTYRFIITPSSSLNVDGIMGNAGQIVLQPGESISLRSIAAGVYRIISRYVTDKVSVISGTTVISPNTVRESIIIAGNGSSFVLTFNTDVSLRIGTIKYLLNNSAFNVSIAFASPMTIDGTTAGTITLFPSQTIALVYSASNAWITLLNTNSSVPATRTVAGFPLSSNITLAALTALNATLTFSGSYDGSTARTIGLNLGNANTWTATQTFQAILPAANATYSLGNSSFTWTTVNTANVSSGATSSPVKLSIGSTEGLRLAGTTGHVLVGTTTDVATGAVVMNSTTGGLLIPRMTTTQRTALTLDGTNDGLQVYDLTLHKLYLNENGTWVQK